ncbi:helix-turn-helix transcriptional regulator [Roseicella frigidaeris]|uniref:helix-turn-helix transcriptional regulator n=1 Tax=Roseicella frigidaeris TaxID=2230885 RepID=UPI001401E5CE|nr:LuxR C-terminal-related transcriptional regulator [Roseicella frigidaeris]
MAEDTLLPEAPRPAPQRPPHRAPVAVALRSLDPERASRLAGLAGLRLVSDPTAADVLVAEAMPPDPGGGPEDIPGEIPEEVRAEVPGAATGVAAGEVPGAVPVLVLAEGAAALQALRAGARGVLAPEAPPAQLEAALLALARGLVVLPPALLPALAGRGPAPAGSGLTRREREVLDLLAAGASNKVIARRLNLSFHTAKAHVASVLQKLGAGSRADAVARGARAGLVLL